MLPMMTDFRLTVRLTLVNGLLRRFKMHEMIWNFQGEFSGGIFINMYF